VKFILYFQKDKINCATFRINDVKHSTHDIRMTPGSPTESCFVTSRITVKYNDGLDTDSEMEELVEEGILTKREFETEPIFIDWNDSGLSYTTINNALVKSPCGKCDECKCLSDI